MDLDRHSRLGTDGTLVFRRSDFDDGVPHDIPDDLRERLSAVRLIRQVEELVAGNTALQTAPAEVKAMAAVLIWCLATGRFGSWDMEALCEEEPLCRHLAGSFALTHQGFHQVRRHQEPLVASLLAEIIRTAVPKTKPDVVAADVQRRLERARAADREVLF
ncbi:MAG: hypothetical protein J0M24_05385 [Verrucomicrobia bacterium]|nr:hypothetical protein [Verrucomicrobiota bacterium]